MPNHRRRLRTFFLLAILAFTAHAFALLGVTPGALPSTGDTLGAFVPWHEFTRQTFAKYGAIPLWDPHLYCGTPFAGNGQSGLLYPPNAIFLILPENLALWLFAFGHNLFLMAGSYFLGRTLGLKRRAAFLTAFLFGLGNAIPGHQFGGHLTFLPVRSFWPWEAAFLLRLLRGHGKRDAVLLAACIALGLTAGAPQIWLFGLLFSAGIFVFWVGQRVREVRGARARFPVRVGWLLVLTAVLAGLWCSPIILPLLELKNWSSHGDSLTFAEATKLSATWRSLSRLVFNGYFGGNSFYMWSLPSNPSEDAASIGLAGLLLALTAPFCARKSRVVPALLVFCGAMFLLAVGNATLLYQFLYGHSSFFQSTRVPARWLELWAFAAALLAGFALDGVLREPGKVRMLLRAYVGAFGACLLVIFATLLMRTPWETGARIIIHALDLPASKIPEIAQNLQTDALTACIISTACVGLIAWFLRKGLKLNNSVVLFLLLVSLEPFCNFWLSTRITPVENFATVHIPQSILRYYEPGQRWIIQAPFAQLNSSLTAGIDVLNGYEPFGSAPFFEYAAAAEPGGSRHVAPFAADFQPKKMVPLWRVAGVSYLLWKSKFKGDSTAAFPGDRAAQSGEWRLIELQDGLRPWPRSYLTNNVVRVPIDERYRTLNALAQRPILNPIPVVVEPGFPSLPSASGARMTMKVHTETPDVLEWDVSTLQDTAFVHQAALAPGWTGYVDNQKVPVYRANGFFRALAVPAQTNRVALVYDSQTLRFALFLTMLGLSIGASAIAVKRAP